MHEFGLCEPILDAIERRAGDRRVTRFTVRVGILNRMDAEAMRQTFAIIAAGSVAEEAEPIMIEVPAQSECADCRATSDVYDFLASCPRCGSVNVSLTGGDELTLQSIEYAAAQTMA